MSDNAVIGYVLNAQDDDSYMLGSTYSTRAPSWKLNWRFGVDGVPHPATCAACGRKTNVKYVSPDFRVVKRRRDATATYDGYLLVSRRVRDYCQRRRLPGAKFVPLPADRDFFWLRPHRVTIFDARRRKTRFAHRCKTCLAYYEVIGATPAYLKDVSRPLRKGFFRTDIEFSCGQSQHPLVIAGADTGAQLRAEEFRGLEFKPIHA